MEKFLELTPGNIEQEHICCAISDQKCKAAYQAKKDWLRQEFQQGYVFRRIDERAKVFIEYGPAERAWLPISADNYLNINCFWVSGKYKKQGYGKALLESALKDARSQKKSGLVTVVGTKKFHFMSDTKWLLKRGFTESERLPYGFSLLVLKLDEGADDPQFRPSVQIGNCPHKKGIVAYYSNRCPFAEYHSTVSLAETAEKRGIPLKVVQIKTLEEARDAPSPATIFSLFLDGRFKTTDISACMDSRYEKVMAKLQNGD